MKKRLTLVIHALHGGGAERTAAEMVNHWSEQSHEVTLITLDVAGNDAYEVGPAVQRVALNLVMHSGNLAQALRNNWQRIRQLRRAILDTQPEVVISFTDRMNILTLLATRRTGLPVIVAERSDPRFQTLSPLWSWLRRWLYPSCAAVVVQTEGVREFIAPLVKGRPIHVIPNFVRQPPPHRDTARSSARRQIVWLGRLSREKGADLLVKAFFQTADKHPDWDLMIAGEGVQRNDIEELVRQLNLAGRIRLLGWANQPAEVLRQAEIFVLSSRYEGFPNALLEAMSLGLAAISFDCPSGPRAIIRDGLDGLLVPAEDVDALAAALERLIADPALRAALGERAREVSERFSVERYFARWEDVLAGAVTRTAPENRK